MNAKALSPAAPRRQNGGRRFFVLFYATQEQYYTSVAILRRFCQEKRGKFVEVA